MLRVRHLAGMVPVAGMVLAALLAIAPWVGPFAAPDDLPAPGEMRLFWEMEPFRAPPGVPVRSLFLRKLIPMADGGILAFFYGYDGYDGRSIFIKVDSQGQEQWRVRTGIPWITTPCCFTFSYEDRVAALPDGGFVVLLSQGDQILVFDADGRLARTLEPAPWRYPQFERILVAPDGSFYLASRARPGRTGGAELIRWSPEKGLIWGLHLPLFAEGSVQYGHPKDLEWLGNGDLLWTIVGDPPMTMGPSSTWQVRVSPSGAIRVPGPLETTIPAGRSGWHISSKVTTNGTLLRWHFKRNNLHQGISKPPIAAFLGCYVEIWDETGSRRTAVRPDLCGRSYVAAIGRHSSYWYAKAEDGTATLMGLDSALNRVWSRSLPAQYGPFGDGSTSRVFLVDSRQSGPQAQWRTSVYLTSVE